MVSTELAPAPRECHARRVPWAVAGIGDPAVEHATIEAPRDDAAPAGRRLTIAPSRRAVAGEPSSARVSGRGTKRRPADRGSED